MSFNNEKRDVELDNSSSLYDGDKDRNELTAAAALTSLVSGRAAAAPEDEKKEEEAEQEYDDEEEEGEGRDFHIPQRFTKSGRKRAVPFPLKLMKVLSCKDYNHIINWMPSGKSFSIKKPKLFTAQILPDHFKSAKYSSFTRKLHRWGFMRHYRGDEAGAFFHEEFQKNRLDLVEKMTCYKQDPPKVVQAVRKQTELPAKRKAITEMVNAPVVQRVSAPVAQRESAPVMRRESAPVIRRDSAPAAAAKPMAVVVPNPTMTPPMLPPCGTIPRRSLDLSSFPQSLEQTLGLRSQLENAGLNFQPPRNPQPTDLDAVIEAEVSRRLTERINAAALSNRLALMQQVDRSPTTTQFLAWKQQQRQQEFKLQQQQVEQDPTTTQFLAWKQQQRQQELKQQKQQQQQQQRNLNCINSGLPLNQQARNALALAAARGGFYKPPPINYAAFGTAPILNTPPPTNIQGARTA